MVVINEASPNIREPSFEHLLHDTMDCIINFSTATDVETDIMRVDWFPICNLDVDLIDIDLNVYDRFNMVFVHEDVELGNLINPCIHGLCYYIYDSSVHTWLNKRNKVRAEVRH